MNTRHRRVAKLRKQELNVLKTKFENMEFQQKKHIKWQVSLLLMRVRLFVSLGFRY